MRAITGEKLMNEEIELLAEAIVNIKSNPQLQQQALDTIALFDTEHHNLIELFI